MNRKRALPPLSMRRANAQRCAAQQRAAISDAWRDFEQREARGELRVRQAVALTRQVASVSAFVAAGLAIRRAARGGRGAWRGLVRRIVWTALARRAMRRNADGPVGKGTRR